MTDHQSPIFFDSTNRRWSLISRILVVFSILCCAAAALFTITIAVNPSLPSLAFSHTASSLVEATSKHNELKFGEKPAEMMVPSNVETQTHAENTYVLHRNADVQEAQRRLALQIRRDERKVPIPQSSISPGHISGPVRVAFYINTDRQESLNSFSKNYQHITHLLPVWLKLTPTGAAVDSSTCNITPTGQPIPESGPSVDDQAMAIARHNGVAVLPVLQNYGNQDFQTLWLHRLLSSPANRTTVINQLTQFVLANQCQGVNVDFENIDASDSANLTLFMSQLAAAFHSNGLIVTQDLPANDDNFDFARLGQINDFVIPMLYDEHSEGSSPGPIASQSWFEQELSNFLSQVPASKIVVGLSNGAYDWSAKGGDTQAYTFGAAARTAQESKDGDDGVIRIDPVSLNPYFTYYDDTAGEGDKEVAHIVWLEDATTAYNQALYAQQYKPLGMAIWKLGSEDPSLWSFFGKDETITNFDTSQLSKVTYNYFGVLTRGEGDILKIIKPQTAGYRKIAVDPRKGYVIAENFQSYPTQYIIQRTGLITNGANKQKIVALTFDDGPDPRWTPQILSILHQYHVPATFFVVGENAEAHPNLVQNEWDQGMEIGNHTFTHPEIVDKSAESDTVTVPLRTKLELDATQRVIEALTGHMTLLFRAPNHADSEPTTEGDFDPIIDAQRLGYIFVGETIDPTDWYPGIKADQITHTVLAGAPNGNCILLHDAGGDTRAETVKALPIIIQQLKARGYKFVLVSTLMGKTRAQAFPAVTGRQLLSVYIDRAIFDITYWLGAIFTALFVATIVLGMLRIVSVSVLAFIQSKKEKKRVFAPDYSPSVSVVIAAYNEAKVINKTISTLLTSDYPDLEIVVVDDGSTDGTAETVRKVYGDNNQVTILTKENGGKATALNIGVRQCRGEIVIALDADTVFLQNTIPLLVRHFSDQSIGAVSGNVKVGNRNNLFTVWQAVEYISSQNFDRRAYDLLNCITVVPGAIGAWRKDAIVLAGMYSTQTLAEDTDLTFRVRRLGYRIVTDNEALAYTEAPDTLRSLFKQRFRWAYGTLQCLWKHRGGLFNPRCGTFGMVAMPSMWIYQIGFQALAPIVDFTVLWSIFYCLVISPSLANKDMLMLGGYWAVYTAVEIIGALPAMIMDKEDVRLVAWLPLQRFVYRQLMYFVILKSIYTAIHGSIVGWGKIERKGTVSQPVLDPSPAVINAISKIDPEDSGDGDTSIDSGDFAQKR